MKMLREFSIALLLSTGALCAMEEQKALLIKQREALEQECNRRTSHIPGAPIGYYRGRAQADQRDREQIIEIDAKLANLPKIMEKQLQEEYDKKLIDYDKQIALMEAEQCRLGDMAQYDTDLTSRLNDVNKARAQEVEKNKRLGKSPAELQLLDLEDEKMGILENLKKIEMNLYTHRNPEDFHLKIEKQTALAKKLAAINTELLSMNTERK